MVLLERVPMDELECMRTIDESLQAVGDASVRARIANWISAKYQGGTGNPVLTTVPDGTGSPGLDSTRQKEVAGIAKLSASGDLQLTVRDLKAKSANDAAIRLLHVAIWASTKLKGEPSVSSKSVLVPLLKRYRCYDGNTRTAIANDKGIVRDGDQRSLDFHAEQLAEKMVREILDPSAEGRWNPGASRRRIAKAATGRGSEA